jgi:hypothetical protein
MVEVAGIQDRETLEVWLKGRSREDAICIAHRAAMRVAPLFWMRLNEDWARHRGLTALDSLLPLLTSGIARRYPTREAMDAAAFATTIAFAAVNSIESASLDPDAAFAFAFAAYAAAAAPEATDAAGDATFAATDAAISWLGVGMDCAALEAGGDPFTLPLWDGPVPEQIADAWARTRQHWARAGGPVWAFWTQFYENALAGRPQDWPLLHDIALIPEEDWKGGPDRVHPIIEGMLLDRARQSTGNGETIAFNPVTGKAYLVPDSALSPDLADYVKRKIAKALAVFRNGTANQYTSLQPDLALLAEVMTGAGTLPVEIFDACASVSRRILHRARMGECPDPERDPLLADFLHRIREAGADILGNDPKAQEVLARRAGIAGNNAFIEGRAVILEAAGLLASVSEGYLAKAVSRDADVATNQASDPEERKVAAFRFAGRLLRYPMAAAGMAGRALIRAGQMVDAYQAIMGLPQVQAAIQLVLRLLG